MENMINYTNNQPSLSQTVLNELKEVVTSALTEEYQTEKHMIDNDINMTTNEKIQARRKSFTFYTCCIGGLLLVTHYLR
jgi:hypothetical protein